MEKIVDESIPWTKEKVALLESVIKCMYAGNPSNVVCLSFVNIWPLGIHWEAVCSGKCPFDTAERAT